MRGEHHTLAGRLERGAQRHATGGLGARQLQGGERGVSLVQVNQVGLDAECLECAHAADAEQGVLRQACDRVSDIQL